MLIIALIVFFVLFFISKKGGEDMVAKKSNETKVEKSISLANLDKAYFAGGCFWCIEAPFQETEGVLESISGYIGGVKENASYNEVSTGETKHRESVEVIYNKDEISYEELLEIFFAQIDPTDTGGQFADRGFQYTTGIYFQNKEEKKLANKFISDLEKKEKFDKKIVVDVLPFKSFFKAEEYHQDFYKKSSAYYKRYKKGSGRTGFIEENWAKELALIEIEKTKKDNALATNQEVGSKSYTATEDFPSKNSWDNFVKPTQKVLKQNLTKLQFKVTQENGTERSYKNKYWDNKDEGIYVDVVSGEPLFSSKDKYKSGTGWPSFVKTIDGVFLDEKKDFHLLYERTEIKSKIAKSHLGHIFPDGPKSRGGLRYCINSASLRFIPKSKMAEEGYMEFLKNL